MKYLKLILLGLVLVSCVALSQELTPTPARVPPTSTTVPAATASPLPAHTPTGTEASSNTPGAGNDPVLVGAGDIAHCRSDGDEITAELLDNIEGTVFTTGDNAYPDGSPANFADCYDPSWGRHKARTSPSPGNHDYHTIDGTGYFEYFGAAAGEAGKGYYSYDLGEWHIVVLNSNIEVKAGSPQELWLREDLAAHPRSVPWPTGITRALAPAHSMVASHQWSRSGRPCTNLARMWSWGAMITFMSASRCRILRAVPIRIAASANSSWAPEAAASINSPPPFPTAKCELLTRMELLKLTLHPTSYTWEFVPEPGKPLTELRDNLLRYTGRQRALTALASRPDVPPFPTSTGEAVPRWMIEYFLS